MPDNIIKLNLDEKEIILIGTAHVSEKSAEEAGSIIREEKPDSVCIELDSERFDSMENPKEWKESDIVTVIKEKKTTLLLVNLILSSYQKRLADQFGIKPGQEMIEAIEAAKAIDAKIVLADRNIKTTFLRIFRKLSLWEKMKLLVNLIAGFLEDEEISEETLEELKGKDMIEAAMSELSGSFPMLKRVLVDERDMYLSQKIKNAKGEKTVAVVGAAHLNGIVKHINEDISLKELNEIPEGSKALKIIGWLIPVSIILMIVFTAVNSFESGLNQIGKWFIYCSSFAGIGTLLAGGHILSIITAFAVAPLTSVHPLLAAGWFAGLTEAGIRKPKVEDFEALSEDLSTIKGLWKNKVTRILLVVLLANVGCAMGTYIAGFEIFKIFTKFI